MLGLLRKLGKFYWELEMTDIKTETRGRPADNTSGLYVTPCRVTIDADTRDFLVRIGHGNISAGVRKLSSAVAGIFNEVKK